MYGRAYRHASATAGLCKLEHNFVFLSDATLALVCCKLAFCRDARTAEAWNFPGVSQDMFPLVQMSTLTRDRTTALGFENVRARCTDICAMILRSPVWISTAPCTDGMETRLGKTLHAGKGRLEESAGSRLRPWLVVDCVIR
jgi:hypothetical protein